MHSAQALGEMVAVEKIRPPLSASLTPPITYDESIPRIWDPFLLLKTGGPTPLLSHTSSDPLYAIPLD